MPSTRYRPFSLNFHRPVTWKQRFARIPRNLDILDARALVLGNMTQLRNKIGKIIVVTWGIWTNRDLYITINYKQHHMVNIQMQTEPFGAPFRTRYLTGTENYHFRESCMPNMWTATVSITTSSFVSHEIFSLVAPSLTVIDCD